MDSRIGPTRSEEPKPQPDTDIPQIEQKTSPQDIKVRQVAAEGRAVSEPQHPGNKKETWLTRTMSRLSMSTVDVKRQDSWLSTALNSSAPSDSKLSPSVSPSVDAGSGESVSACIVLVPAMNVEEMRESIRDCYHGLQEFAGQMDVLMGSVGMEDFSQKVAAVHDQYKELKLQIDRLPKDDPSRKKLLDRLDQVLKADKVMIGSNALDAGNLKGAKRLAGSSNPEGWTTAELKSYARRRVVGSLVRSGLQYASQEKPGVVSDDALFGRYRIHRTYGAAINRDLQQSGLAELLAQRKLVEVQLHLSESYGGDVLKSLGPQLYDFHRGLTELSQVVQHAQELPQISVEKGLEEALVDFAQMGNELQGFTEMLVLSCKEPVSGDLVGVAAQRDWESNATQDHAELILGGRFGALLEKALVLLEQSGPLAATEAGRDLRRELVKTTITSFGQLLDMVDVQEGGQPLASLRARLRQANERIG